MAQFKIGNKAAEKWTEQNTYDVFMRMLSVAQEDEEVLCIQDVLHHPEIKLYRSGMDYLLEKFPVFGKYKKDIQDAIVSRINKGALNGDLVSTPAIFRMKQLGEEEKQVHEVTQNIRQSNIIVDSKQDKEVVNALLSKFESEDE